MSLGLYKQKYDLALESSQRTVLPPNKSTSSSESNNLPSLVSKVQYRAIQEGQHSRLSTVNNLKQLEPSLILTSSDNTVKLSSSENLDHRMILSRTSLDAGNSQSQRRVLLPQGKSKSGPPKTAEPAVQQSHISVSANEHTMTRQACEEELEFLKLKLRYMQNDIEFKKNQIDSAKISQPKSSTIPHKWSRNSRQISVRTNTAQDAEMTSTLNCYPHPNSRIYPSASATKWSAQVAGLQQFKTKADSPTFSSKHEKTILSNMVSKVNTFPVFTKSENASASTSQLTPGPSADILKPTSSFTNVRTVYSVCMGTQNTHVSSTGVINSNCVSAQQKYFAKGQTIPTSFPSFLCPTDNNVVSYRSETEIPLSNTSTTTINTVSAFVRLGNQGLSEAAKVVYVSPDKRLVLLSSKTVPSDSTQTSVAERSSLINDRLINSAKVHVTSRNEGITKFNQCGTYNRLHDIEHSEKSSEMSMSRYKLVKYSPNSPIGMRNAQTTFRDSASVSLSPCSDSKKHTDVSSFILPTKAAAAAQRGSQASRLSLRSPNVKIQTAAKLVSKYKLKKLSPTSASTTTPLLFYDKAHCMKSSLVYDQVAKKPFSPHSKNKHKLDRRPAAAKFSYNKFKGDIYSSPVNVLTKKHKIDRRPHLNPSFKNFRESQMPLSRSELKIDKRASRQNVFLQKVDVHRIKNVHILDRRSFKFDKFKVNPRQAVVDKGGQHYWISDQLITHTADKGSRRTKYSWRKASTLQARSSYLSTSHSSRFKWSRPTVQAQNGAWQQLRQKLQLLLIKKHRHSRFKFSKYTCLAAASSIYNKTLKVGDYKTSLVTIDGITYKSSSRKLTRTRRSSAFPSVKRSTPAPRITSASAPNTASSAPVNARKSSSSLTDINVMNLANRAIHRSIAITAAKYRKNNQKSNGKSPYCIYFGRFGKCSRGEKCPYVHDPEKIAVCTRFLRGRCDVQACPFSHKASKNKIPVCLFYLRGSCSRDSCPYLHVRVNPSAPVCKDFCNGFCALGEKCKKIHSHVCPSFAMTGTCSRAETCTMLHRTSKREQDGLSPQTKNARRHHPADQKKIVPHLNNEYYPGTSGKSIFTPICTTSLAVQPSFISLETSPTPSFISLEPSQQKRKNEREETGKPGFALGKVEDTVFKLAQDSGTSIRPSFLANKLVANKTVEHSIPPVSL